ncbi:cupin domain-containing protein [Actinomarinicola tropica]|uniref:cupin domain-containing protein n=1 Tax=Actinomarinicola tropica TaxID=2789776 RepID=UPI001899CA1A|nr:cupin domain-containing protein [Actinomarinicola tropica]
MSLHRGHLPPDADGPDDGEVHVDLASTAAFRVEHISSGRVSTPVEFLQLGDEWVVVLEGSAILEIDEERVELGPGDWVLVPGSRPHRLLRVEPGTRWLAVHGTTPPT